jgi:hypothetical protein
MIDPLVANDLPCKSCGIRFAQQIMYVLVFKPRFAEQIVAVGCVFSRSMHTLTHNNVLHNSSEALCIHHILLGLISQKKLLFFKKSQHTRSIPCMDSLHNVVEREGGKNTWMQCMKQRLKLSQSIGSTHVLHSRSVEKDLVVPVGVHC